MTVSSEIKRIELGEEFRICPNCGYERGFHSSFQKAADGYRIVLICPTAGRGTMWDG